MADVPSDRELITIMYFVFSNLRSFSSVMASSFLDFSKTFASMAVGFSKVV